MHIQRRWGFGARNDIHQMRINLRKKILFIHSGCIISHPIVKTLSFMTFMFLSMQMLLQLYDIIPHFNKN